MINESMLDSLRESVSGRMSPKRFVHTAEVEKMAARLGELYAPERVSILRAAALLHDITKEQSPEWHIRVCCERGIELDGEALCAPKTFHAVTAAALIPEAFPDFATEEIVGCVRWHTTGRVGMTLLERLIYLADYIDMSRTFEDCVKLREYFFGVDLQSMSEQERLSHLNDTLIMSFDMTIRGLLDEGKIVSRETVAARNALVMERVKSKE